MKIIYAIAAYLLVLAFPVCTAKGLPPPPSDPEALYSNKVGKSPAGVIDHYERQAPTTSADFFTLALAYYAKVDFLRALDLANRALALQSDPSARSVCFVLIAECHGALGQYDLAADAALQGLRLKSGGQELEKDLAALRLTYTRQAGDDVAARAAEDHLMQLDSDFNRTPTVDPVTGTVIIVIAVYAIWCLTKVILAKIASDTKNPEVAKAILQSMEPSLDFGKVAGLLAAFTAAP